MIITLDEFLKLRQELPAVDVRSEGEFAEGHIPGVINIPLLNNQERVAVGTEYKQKGQLEAIKTGFRLVGPRLNGIIDEALCVTEGRELLVHCWRGGMRSANFCSFVQMAGIKTHALKGGYKAYRQQAVASFALPFNLIVLGGETGSGKSEILRALKAAGEQVIDLELLAQHKGSVFGGLSMPTQPTTEQFQNDLFETVLKLDVSRRIWIEDESIAIGKIFLPEPLWRTMNQSQVVEIDVPKEIRIQRLVKEYGETDPEQFLEAMKKITKKLGGQHFNIAAEKLLQNDWSSTIDVLLTYYDKAYRNGLERKQKRIVKRLSWDGKSIDLALKDILTT
ncbi:MAG: tRNA 2-selenouridine(34) synthase MnmH [Cyclobacteriaceae bacterium]|nr:tRNA 2-selenouridine(34) synthase MnmH [Cyclobacteriaceae bacterium]